MSQWRISRRTVLRGIGAAVSLPLLDVMEPVKPVLGAAPIRPTNRVCYLYIPNGVATGAWSPERVGPKGKLQKLNAWMAPLEPLKEHLVIPRNMWTPRGNGHGAGTATWLTGHGYDGRRIDAGGTSADQLAAKAVGDQTLLPSIDLSMRGEGFFSNSLVRNTISWSSRSTPVPRDVEPRVVFDRMFRAGSGDASERSVLDSVIEDARRMRRRVSVDDRRKIDEYLESMRSIERRLDFADQQSQRAAQNKDLTNALVRPAAGIPADHQEYMRTMFDTIALAYWSDATRVCSFMLDHGQSNRYFNFIDGVQGTWHALSHWKDASGRTEDDDGVTSWNSVQEKRDMYNAVTKWHHEQVAYFLDRLRRIKEPGGGSLLDNSMILYGSSLGDGHAHSERNLPLLLAGGGAGTIQTGRIINFRRATSLSSLHLAMLQRVGVPIESFGESNDPMELG